MSKTPADLQYTSSHEWLRQEDNGEFTLGITDHGQQELGDLVYIELPEIGSRHDSGSNLMVLESVKAASDVYAPLSATIVAVNEQLSDNPELVNTSPYEEGWLLRLKADDQESAKEMLDHQQYRQHIGDE